MPSIPLEIKCRIAESLLSCGELYQLRDRVTSEADREILSRAIQTAGSVVKDLLSEYGLTPLDGAKIYTEIMASPENGDREIYHKMTNDQKSEILIINSKKFI